MLVEACASRRRSRNSGILMPALILWNEPDRWACYVFCSVKFILHELVDDFDQFWCTFTLKCVTVCLVALQFLDVMHAVTIRRTIRRYRRKTCPIGSVLHFGEFWQLRVSFVSLLVRSAAVLTGRDCTTSSYRIHARRRLLSETEPDRELRGRLARLKVACAQG